jgi:hypothetical protein
VTSLCVLSRTPETQDDSPLDQKRQFDYVPTTNHSPVASLSQNRNRN